MSFYMFVVLAGILSSLIFLAGCVKGMKDAIDEHGTVRDPADDVDRTPRVGLGAFFAFIVSGLVITLAGFSSAWIYAGVLLNIVTTVAVGAAFFMDRPRSAF
jgi:hypothetical protein